MNPFDRCSETYSKFRPEYPEDLIDRIQSLLVANDSLLLDIGAGTGKASAQLAARGISVISLDPSRLMIRQGLRSYPNLRYACSTAEQLAVSSHSADAVICAQAFHWFDAQQALAEFARVLKPRGHVCLFWNTRDTELEAAQYFDELIHKWNPGHDPGYRKKDWAKSIAASGLFPSIEHQRFRMAVPMTVDEWIGLSRSISYVQSMGAEKLRNFEAALREGLSRLKATDCAYITELWLAQ